MIMIAALGFDINENYRADIYLVGTFGSIDWESGRSSLLGEEFSVYDYKDTRSGKNAIFIDRSVDGKYILRFIETKRYIIKIKNKTDIDTVIPLPHFQNEENKFLKIDRDNDSVSFQFVNYLGRSNMTFSLDTEKRRLFFEVVPDKMNYEQDYISLTESIAQECAGLLMEYSGTTSNLYSQSDKNQKSILEQFIFLRQFCYESNLLGLFEAIKRNPDRILITQEEFEPIGNGRPSKKFYSNPFSYSKGWGKIHNSLTDDDVYMPQLVAVAKKQDSVDTPANRFVKYALQRFDQVCLDLLGQIKKQKDGNLFECYYEAESMHTMIDDILRNVFFDEVNELDIMPQNNQVLQKRQGYSQIFSAYLMIDLAIQLDWKGKDEVYEGESKNVALLYEYWLFFELYKIIKSISGCECVQVKENPFLLVDDGITISLEQGKKSCQSFVVDGLHMKINLYYNRMFSRKDFRTTLYEGSYSRPFRPDYTLAIFPAVYSKGKYNGEEEAIRDGAVSYIHFDAKYRITDLTSMVGNDTDNGMEEILEDKIESITNTYKRGDLLKMHTYNDAIRRTIGSYVLYPGSGDLVKSGKAAFNLYDEVLPGVGAFAIRPSIDEAGEQELKKFIVGLLKVKSSDNSRLNRMKYYMEMVLREPSVSNSRMLHTDRSGVSLQGKNYIMGYIRGDLADDYYYHLKDSNLLENGKEFWFYFYAIKGENVYSHHKDIFRTKEFRFYKNHIRNKNSYLIEPVLCKVLSNELVSRKELVQRLQEQGYETGESGHGADFYYVLKVKVVDANSKQFELLISDVNAQNGNDTFSPHSPKIITC